MISPTRRSRGRSGAGATVLAAVLLAGCSSVVQGHGSAGPSASSASSSSPDFPSTTPTPASTAPPTSATPTSATPTSSSPIAPTSTQRLDALTRSAPGDDTSELVAVPGGYEAATWDQVGHIRFWFDPTATTAWRRVGTSSYPYSAAVGPPDASVEGTLLRRMTHATFIISGTFTGDGSGNAVAFTTGGRGWGAIKAESNGNIAPSGRPVGRDRIGLSYGFAFAQGYLVTADCPQDRPLSECGGHQIRKRWLWRGSEFRQV